MAVWVLCTSFIYSLWLEAGSLILCCWITKVESSSKLLMMYISDIYPSSDAVKVITEITPCLRDKGKTYKLFQNDLTPGGQSHKVFCSSPGVSALSHISLSKRLQNKCLQCFILTEQLCVKIHFLCVFFCWFSVLAARLCNAESVMEELRREISGQIHGLWDSERCSQACDAILEF